MNMGTPAYPEGTPHWSTKAVLWHRLKSALSLEGPSHYYGMATPHEFRNVSVAHDAPSTLEGALERLKHRPYPRRSCFHICYRESSDCECGGGFAVVHNLLYKLRGGRVEMEEAYNGFIPDISLYARDSGKPKAIIEVVDTSFPSEHKIDAMRRQGIDVYMVRVGADARGADDNDPLNLDEPFIVEPVAVSCRKPDMVKLLDLDSAVWDDYNHEMEDYSTAIKKVRDVAEGGGGDMATLLSPLTMPLEAYIGVKTWATGTQQYIYGRASHSASWCCSDKFEIRAFTQSSAPFSGPELVEPVTTNHISRDRFMDYLVFLKLQSFAETADWREGGPPPRIHPKRHVAQIDDLLSMVGWPNG